MQEVSETDGKAYRVQYFERAVFELHPENQAPNDVLLSLLGVFRYKERYPSGRIGGVTSEAQPGSCRATHDDSDNDPGVGFAPEAPERQVVGSGLVLTGRVLSSRDCAPVAGAKLEMRPEMNNSHPDDQRATLYTDASGRYRFESDFPEHIHMRVAAHGFKRIITNAYHTAPGKSVDSFDVVLAPDPSCELFSETGHAVCGAFLSYWNTHGGLAQQGLPISDEFMEKSDLNGKDYRVQYFERAVFELHPENATPYDVLLSQLGTFKYRAKYGQARVGRVEAIGDMAVERSCQSSTLLANGKVLIAGGMIREGNYSSNAELYDPATGRFSPTGSMSVGRACHTATLLPSGKVLIVAGSYGGRLDSAELYDPATGTFSATGSLGTERDAFTATLLKNGKVLIAGGFRGDMLASAELYDPATGSFTPAGNMNEARAIHTATLLSDGKVLVTGGGWDGVVLQSAEIYDPATGRFSRTGNMTIARYKHAAVGMPGGKVLIVGGSDNRDWRGRYTSVEVYDPATGVFVGAGNMRTSRFKLADAVASLADGRLLVTGGGERAEVYDPRTGVFALAEGEMDTARFYQSATALPDGTALITGGYDTDIKGTARAWIYRP
jgi:hypothetical protein